MKHEFIQEMAERCRALAGNADIFTKRRLLELATGYDALAIRRSPGSRKNDWPVQLGVSNQGAATPPLPPMKGG
jgi:hypothetical protein